MAAKRIATLVMALPVVVGFLALAVAGGPSPSVAQPQAQQVAPPTGEPTVQAVSIERYATASALDSIARQAQLTADAAQADADGQRAILTAEAGLTVDALSARATTQALDGLATAQAVAYAATATAEAYHVQDRATRQADDATRTAQAVAATVTAQAVEGTRQANASTRTAVEFVTGQTRQAQSFKATRTAVAHTDNATRTALQATVTAVAWTGNVERVVKPVLTVGGILALVAFVVVGFLLAWRFAKVLEARLHIVSPPVNAKETIIIEKLADGGTRYALPHRTVNPVTTMRENDVDSPIIAPSVAAQMVATLAQQKSNLVRAGQTGQVARAAARVPNFVRVSPRSVYAQPAPVPQGMEQGQPWGDVTPHWPGQVPLGSLFSDKRPSLSHIVIGVAPRDGGGLDVVSSNLHDLMHTLLVGASGWGKSSWLRAFLWQIEKSPEPVEVLAMDVSGSELNALSGWSKLRYPVARTVGESVVILGAVQAEVERRKALFETCPSASKLSEYNAQVSDPLAPWVIVADEGAALLNDKRTGGPLRDAIQTARQYGIYAVVATVSANASVIPTPLRDQFSTRLAFRVNSITSSNVVVEDSGAAKLTTKGRALVRLSGQELREIQGPFLGRGEFVRSMAGDGPQMALPDLAESAQVDGRAAMVAELLAGEEKLSDTAIARQVYGHGNSHYIEKVRSIKAEWEQQQQHSDNDNGQEGV